MKIYVSMDSSAQSVGAGAVLKQLHARYTDKKIITTGSLGALWLEPVVMVEKKGLRHIFANLNESNATSIINNGEVNTSHEGYIGRSSEFDFLIHQNRQTFTYCGLYHPSDFDQWRELGGGLGIEKALRMDAQNIIDEVKNSGLRGRGGAGFPTGIKWQTVLSAKADKKYIVCNADEGDSGTFADRMIIEGDPFTLIEGMVIAALATGAEHGYIYLRSEYPHAKNILEKALVIARKNQLLGDSVFGSGKTFNLALRMGAGAYICGEETSLLESLEGKRGIIRYKPPLPAIEGLFAQPTVVNNVITLASIPTILAHGGKKYHDFGVEKSRGTLTVQLAGNIARGGLYEVDFGTSLKQLLENAGGTASGRPIRAVQAGGPLGAYIPESKLDIALDYEAFASAGFMIGHGGFVVFDDTVDMAQQAQFSMQFCADESCGKCTPCRIGSVRGVELIAAIRADSKNNIDSQTHKQTLRELCDTMTHTSLCAMGGLTPMPVLSALDYFPEDFMPG